MPVNDIKQISKPWQEELAITMIANPTMSMGELARLFGVTATWLSIVKNSDSFKAHYERLRNEHFTRVSTNLTEKVMAVAEVAVDAIAERLDQHHRGAKMTTDELLATGKFAMTSLGFGGNRNAPPAVQNNNTVVVVGDANALRSARETLKQVRQINDALLEDKSSSDTATPAPVATSPEAESAHDRSDLPPFAAAAE